MSDDRIDVLLREWGAQERADAGPVPGSLIARLAAAPEQAPPTWHRRALLPLAAAAAVVAVVAGAALLGGPRAAQNAAPPVPPDPRVLSVDGEDAPACPDCSDEQSLSIYDPQVGTSTALTVDGPAGAVVATTGTGDGTTFYISRLAPGECASVVLRLEVRDGGRAVQSELFRPDGVVYDLAVRPDGKSLAYVSTQQQPGMDAGSCSRAELRLRDLEDATERTLPPTAMTSGPEGAVLAGSLSWSSNGDRLLFITQECCQTTTTLHAVRPAEVSGTGHLRSQVVLRDSELACVLVGVVQRPDDLLIEAEGCRRGGAAIQLIVWNEQDRSPLRLPTGVRTSGLSYRNGKVLAERAGEVGLIADDGQFTRLTSGYLPAW